MLRNFLIHVCYKTFLTKFFFFSIKKIKTVFHFKKKIFLSINFFCLRKKSHIFSINRSSCLIWSTIRHVHLLACLSVTHVTCQVSCVTCCMSSVICHMLGVMCQVSHLMFIFNFFFCKVLELVGGWSVINMDIIFK